MQNCKALIHDDRLGVKWRSQLGCKYHETCLATRIISSHPTPAHSEITSPKLQRQGRQRKRVHVEANQRGRRREASEAAWPSPSSWHLAQRVARVASATARCRQAGTGYGGTAWGKMVKRPGASTVLMTRSRRASMQRRQADRSCTNHTQRDTKPFC